MPSAAPREQPGAKGKQMGHSQPLVSVIVLSYKRPQFLAAALDSIRSQSYLAVEVIVVDNNSAESAEIERLVRGYSGVKLVMNAVNLGYTGGMNAGLIAASGEYVHFTTDDVQLERDCLEHLVKYDQAHSVIGLLGGTLLTEDRETICCAGGEFALDAVYHRKNFGEGEKDIGQFACPFEVSCIDGAMIFGRTEFLRALGGFRSEFFVYSDSIELSARVHKVAGRIVIVPKAKAYVHNAPHAFTDERLSFHRTKNLYAMYLLHARWRVLPEFFLRYGLIVPLRSMYANRKMAWPLVRAWAWFLFRAPSLVYERVRGTRYGQLPETRKAEQ